MLQLPFSLWSATRLGGVRVWVYIFIETVQRAGETGRETGAGRVEHETRRFIEDMSSLQGLKVGELMRREILALTLTVTDEA